VAVERVFLIAPQIEADKPDAKVKGGHADLALK
jgi:hypothetical protein